MKTSKQAIIDYWRKRIDECELPFDWSEASNVCWHCGYTNRRLQRCHIVPDSLGGEDAPHNLVLLCEECHREGPNVADSSFMWLWIKAAKKTTIFYDQYWTALAVSFAKEVYGVDLLSLAQERGYVPNSEAVNEVFNKLSWHWGSCGLNTATRAAWFVLAADLAEKNPGMRHSTIFDAEKVVE